MDKRKGFDSLYKTTYTDGWELKNLGFDYSNSLLKKTLSSYLFRNRNLNDFLQLHLNKILVFYVNQVKYLRIFNNFAVPKDYDKIN